MLTLNSFTINNYLILSKNPILLNNKLISGLRIKYNFLFISLTSPFIINNLKLTYLDNDERKIFVKQSYMLLTWFYYLSNLIHLDSKKRLKIATLPSLKRAFTLTKSPMAHKNWSKEQYKLQYFKFKVSFDSTINLSYTINSLNSAILFFLITKKNIFSFETNTFFLKYLNVLYSFKDNTFFKYKPLL